MAAREDECKEAPTRTRTQAQTRDPALYVLFQRYAGLGQDHFGPSDRDAMSLSNFSSLMRDAGVDAAPGAVAVAFEQRAIPGRRRGLTDFDGFVHIVRELAVESGLANGEEAFVHHLQRKNPRAWAEAIQAWAARQPRSPRERPLDMEGKWAGAQELHQEHQQEHQQKAHEEHQKLHQGGIDDAEAYECEKETVANETCEIVAIENVDVESALKRDIFAFYANEADNRLTFTSFVQFTRDFQLHPRLCSRRSLVRAFQTAAGTETLTMQDFDVALENLAEAIFAHSYVAKAVRERPRETLMDFLRSYCELIAEIREELRNRRRRRKLVSPRTRPGRGTGRFRSPPLASPASFEEFESWTTTSTMRTTTTTATPSVPSSSNRVVHTLNEDLRMKENENDAILAAASRLSSRQAAPAALQIPASTCADDEEEKADRAEQDKEDMLMLRAPPTPPAHANHRVTIYPDGTIDVLRVSYTIPAHAQLSHSKSLAKGTPTKGLRPAQGGEAGAPALRVPAPDP